MEPIEQISKPALKKKILDVLAATAGGPDPKQGKHRCGMLHRTALVLATSYRDQPRATVLEFFTEGLDIYILGGPGHKIANIKRNPRVSACIYEQPLDHRKIQPSLQIFGSTELITIRSNPRLFRAKLKKWNLDTVMRNLLGPAVTAQNLQGEAAELFIAKNTDACTLIKIIPREIILKEYYPDFSFKKYVWIK